MHIELKKWALEDRERLTALCNSTDRTYLSNRIPFPYTETDADWWLGKAQEHEGADGIFRAVTVDGQIVGNISVEQKGDVYCKDAEIGYLLDTEHWSKVITVSWGSSPSKVRKGRRIVRRSL